jgi:hypothetical protein
LATLAPDVTPPRPTESAVAVVTPAAPVLTPAGTAASRGAPSSAAPRPSPFRLEGVSSHLGKFTAHGEVGFTPDEFNNNLMVGRGVIVIRAANGDQLVGVASWSGQFYGVSWRDSVRFSDGTVVGNTGQFVDNRPQSVVADESQNSGSVVQYATVEILASIARVIGLVR